MRKQRVGTLALILLVAGACASDRVASTSVPVATSFDDVHAAYCSAWKALFQAVGNPDTASGSELTRAMDAAIGSGDASAVEAVARAIREELETGRRHVGFAAGWQPAGAPMAQLDRIFVAFEAMIEAKRSAAGQGLDVARAHGQAAFEAAGGLDAWNALLERSTWAEVEAARPSGLGQRSCDGIPVSL